MGVGRDILISKKLLIVTMRTMWKHFPVSCLTSKRLAFMNQSEAESTNLKKIATIEVAISHVKKKVKLFCSSKERIYRTTAAEYPYFIIHKLLHCN